MFGEHKGDPCPCGYPNEYDVEIRRLRAELKDAQELLARLKEINKKNRAARKKL
jgi:hypothetical protein